ncbi:MAG TPA: cation diffusion facilitator family transporter [Bryobacteraceae bacterium]|jgi:cation diffusion facilitator family transporter|nr:cation diffusion facilitator family transporter [Bryobacteraceae bacterium]
MTPISIARDEKQSAALGSLVAAVGITAFKVIVGVLTGSLGILAEAAHSALDLVAALVTFLAVRFSARPADHTHLYGHGKIENLSALFETTLLLATCLWIVREAARRLLFHQIDVEVNFWSYAVMLTSIAIDVSRSRVLARAAVKFHSQALEADALHFSTDIWSSAVVVVGLIGVQAGTWFPSLAFLRQADAVAALGVSLLVVSVSLKLGRRTIDALLDRAPDGMEQQVANAVEAVPGVRNCHQVRLRYSGPVLFVDLHVLVDGKQTLAEAHNLTDAIENAILIVAPRADVTVHAEPE